MNLTRGLFGRGFIATVVLAAGLLMANLAQANCCICKTGNNNCPQNLYCSTSGDIGNSCAFLCANGCDVFQESGGVCGQGDFANCSVIDPTPVPTATPTATITDTPTITPTPTITDTPTVTQTPTASPVPQGGACSTPSQCGTGNCADGVCCDTVCNQPLQQCNLSGQVGTCASTAAAAPAASIAGLLAMLAVLMGTAFVALRLRRN